MQFILQFLLTLSDFYLQFIKHRSQRLRLLLTMETNNFYGQYLSQYNKKHIFGQKRPRTYKSYGFVLLISSMYYLSFVYYGYITVYFNSINFNQIVKIFSISMPKVTAELVYSGIPMFGACLGSLGTRFLISRFSRNQNFIIGNSVAIFAGILVLIPNMSTLFIGRLIQGMCVGLFCSITPLTVKQFSPIQISGAMTGLNGIFIAIGLLVGYFSGWICTSVFQDSAYKYFLLFGTTFSISFLQLFWVTVLFPYETPKYLLEQGRINEAKQVIQKIYLSEYQHKVLSEKMLQLQDKASHEETHDQYAMTQQEISQTNTSTFCFLSCLFLVVTEQMTGFNILLIYAPQLTRVYLPNLTLNLSLIIDIQKILFALIATFYLFNRFSRKRLIVVGTFLTALSLYSLVYGFYKQMFRQVNGDLYIFFGIIGCVLTVSSTIGPLAWVYISQVLEPSVIPYIVFLKWLINFLSITFFPILRQHSTNQACGEIFLVFFLFTPISGFLLQHTLVDTKDKNQIQIHWQIQRKQDTFRKLFCKCLWSGNRHYKINTHWNRS